jgi:hypothetical protein
MRTMERIEQPSTMAETTWARLASESLFILSLLHSAKHSVKHKYENLKLSWLWPVA